MARGGRNSGEEKAGNKQGNKAHKARGFPVGDDGAGFPGTPADDMVDRLGPTLALVAKREWEVGFGFEDHGGV